MTWLNPRQDLFVFNLPNYFFNDEILGKYNKYLKQYDSVIPDIADILNESLQDVTLPAFEYTPVEQSHPNKDSTGSPVFYVNPQNVQNLPTKTITVTFRHADSYLTYWMMLEHFFRRYDATKEKHATFGNMPIQMLSSSGHVTTTVTFENVLFTGMSELPLSYANQDRSFRSFTCTFYYSRFNTTFDVPQLNLKT